MQAPCRGAECWQGPALHPQAQVALPGSSLMDFCPSWSSAKAERVSPWALQRPFQRGTAIFTTRDTFLKPRLSLSCSFWDAGPWLVLSGDPHIPPTSLQGVSGLFSRPFPSGAPQLPSSTSSLSPNSLWVAVILRTVPVTVCPRLQSSSSALCPHPSAHPTSAAHQTSSSGCDLLGSCDLLTCFTNDEEASNQTCLGGACPRNETLSGHPSLCRKRLLAAAAGKMGCVPGNQKPQRLSFPRWLTWATGPQNRELVESRCKAELFKDWPWQTVARGPRPLPESSSARP